MSEEKNEIEPIGEKIELINRPDRSEQGYVLLPYDQEQFRDFIKGLLGSAQSIGKDFDESFDIDLDDIVHVNSVLVQRVTQQNYGRLINFLAKITFDDDSTVELSSMEEFRTYNEIRPVVSKNLHLSWDFLVQFADKGVPEKQRIELSFVTQVKRSITFIDTIAESSIIGASQNSRTKKYSRSLINYRISHTGRTWGVDMSALLDQVIRTFLRRESALKTLLKH